MLHPKSRPPVWSVRALPEIVTLILSIQSLTKHHIKATTCSSVKLDGTKFLFNFYHQGITGSQYIVGPDRQSDTVFMV